MCQRAASTRPGIGARQQTAARLIAESEPPLNAPAIPLDANGDSMSSRVMGAASGCTGYGGYAASQDCVADKSAASE